MKRDGQDIRGHPLRESINTGISYGMAFAEWDAAVFAGLDLWKWEQGEYPNAFKARVIAFHSLKRAIDLNSQDAVARHAARKARSKKR